MKRLSMLLLLIVCIGYVFAQNHRLSSNWSIEARAGLNYYRVAVDEPTLGVSSFEIHKNNGGYQIPVVRIRYSLNEITDIGVDYGYYTFNRFRVVGNTQDITLFSSVNLSEAFNSYRPRNKKNWNMFGSFGVGAGQYYYNRFHTKNTGSGFSPLLTAALNLELNLSRSWAISGELQYRFYFTKNISGITADWYNDALVASFGIRYKFKNSTPCRCEF